MSYDSLITDRGFEFAKKFALIYRTMMICDESTAIKSTKAVRSKRVKAVGAMTHYRWIATGTPVAQSPFDCHSQIEFLCPSFWTSHGMRTKDSFKTEFGTYTRRHLGGGRQFNELTGYRRLDYLNKLLIPISSRLLKEDSEVDLPPKIYTTRTFELHPKQRDAYDSLVQDFIAELDSGMFIEAPLAITRLIRLQQICSGFVTAEEIVTTRDDTTAALLAQGVDDPVALEVLADYSLEQGNDGAYGAAIHKLRWQSQIAQRSLGETTKDQVEQINLELAANIPLVSTRRIITDIVTPSENPRLQLLLSLLDEATPHKVIVWCRFTRDVDLICQSLGDAAIRYDGSVSAADRELALTRFRNPADQGRVFVANVHAISMGVTLTIAKVSIYYTNSHSPEKRLQSEDRNHRIGQDVSVQIIDLVAEGTCDVKLIEALIKKHDIAAMVTGDRWREWITIGGRDEETAD
jgi:SNF2 family DNA or RNA helicase